jgi:hypothetical protein
LDWRNNIQWLSRRDIERCYLVPSTTSMLKLWYSGANLYSSKWTNLLIQNVITSLLEYMIWDCWFFFQLKPITSIHLAWLQVSNSKLHTGIGWSQPNTPTPPFFWNNPNSWSLWSFSSFSLSTYFATPKLSHMNEPSSWRRITHHCHSLSTKGFKLLGDLESSPIWSSPQDCRRPIGAI